MQKEPEEEKETVYKTVINNVKLIYDENRIYESVPVKPFIDGTKTIMKFAKSSIN